jgi:RNA polymerase sigma-70 factor (ECF subfamily)
MDPGTQLLLAAAGGDRDALADYIRLSQADVWRFCASMLSVEAADDATQDTFVRVWRSARTFRGDSSARTWTLAIARRACGEAIRRRDRAERQRQAARPTGTGPDPAGAVALTDLVTRLAPDRREAFVLTQLLGLTYQEAADVAAIPVGTIRSRVARARAELQTLATETARPDGAQGNSARF